MWSPQLISTVHWNTFSLKICLFLLYVYECFVYVYIIIWCPERAEEAVASIQLELHIIVNQNAEFGEPNTSSLQDKQMLFNTESSL